MNYIKFFCDLRNTDVPLVGGKNASLGEMYATLKDQGIEVPGGFALTSDAYRFLVDRAGIGDRLREIVKDLDVKDSAALQKAGEAARELFLQSTLPEELVAEIKEAYKKLSEDYSTQDLDVAVRSSATAEDLADASFAGQQETYLHIKGEEALLDAIRHSYASLFTDRAISYRTSHGFDQLGVALSIGVQKMVRSDMASSGVMFTVDTETGSHDLIFITSIFGLGENIVGGEVNPDEFYVFKPTLKSGKDTILKRQLGSKQKRMIYADEGHTKNIDTTPEEQSSFSINDEEILQLARAALTIEEHYSELAGQYRPMDIEWAKDGRDGKLYIVQARPETVQSQKITTKLELYQFKKAPPASEKLLSGRAVGERIGSGQARLVRGKEDFASFQEGEVLVAEITDPDWEPVMKKAVALITDKGGRTCHAAIVAREIGVPAIVGTHSATSIIKGGEEVTVSCAEGETGNVYRGIHDYEIEEIDLSSLPQPKTKLYMNVGNPEQAFQLAQLPNDGVGLARMEFIISNAIKVHPLALLDLAAGKEISDRTEIENIISGYSSPENFFIERLSEGIGMIAAAFFPRPVIVRTSDFKSNEYRNLVGGAPYEPEEENPMIGFRGASRYYSEKYRPAFELECRALKKLRDDMGLTNIKVMIPFVRTPDEGRKVIQIMNDAGLIQGKNDLEIYAMCEIPSNVIFADEFLKVFDGYSIGSNDLTQLTLGVDRDSDLVSHIFDERNEAVKRMLAMAIRAAKERNKYIGICGQAPSDYPEITRFLIEEKIDSISLNPDSLLKMRQVVVEMEKEKG